jgi:oligopeptide/dipeptide ABC transporter ATP-binding protein
LTIEEEEIVGIVGESGSGKSMCVSAMLDAVVDPGVTSGEVIYHGAEGEAKHILDLEDEELRQLRWEEISMVSQSADTVFNPTMTIGAHFRETIEQHDEPVGEHMDRAEELLTDLHLSPDRVLSSYPHELSGGMKQRALIALALIFEPKLLLMDEPTAALDLLMQRSIIKLLSKLKEKYDLTLVIVSHDLPLLSQIADRMCIMYAFELIEIGPTEEIINNGAHPYTRALINTVPNVHSDTRAMQSIPGSSPEPMDVPSGCSYHTRCPLADTQCEQRQPPLENVDDGHLAACFYTEQAEEAVPIIGKQDATTERGGDTDE